MLGSSPENTRLTVVGKPRIRHPRKTNMGVCLQESRPTISRINLEFYAFNQQFLRVFNLLPLALLSDGNHRPGLD